MDIVGLGYVGFGAPDPEAWRNFGHDVVGLEPAIAPNAGAPVASSGDISVDGSLYFKLDDWSWRIAVHPDSENSGIQYIGFEVRDRKALKQALAELADAGFHSIEGTQAQARARAVTEIGFTRDPAGNAIELFYGPLVDGPLRSSKGIKFMTGDMGLGHMNLFVQDYDACELFYTEILGFRLTDYYNFGEDQTIRFFHINPRHHTIGLMKMAPVNALHHIMFEVADIDMVGMALDRAMAAGCKIEAGLGRHSNDQMFSFYMASPFGFNVEIGTGAIRVGDDWTPRAMAPGDIWGHHGLTAEGIEDAGAHVHTKDVGQ